MAFKRARHLSELPKFQSMRVKSNSNKSQSLHAILHLLILGLTWLEHNNSKIKYNRNWKQWLMFSSSVRTWNTKWDLKGAAAAVAVGVVHGIITYSEGQCSIIRVGLFILLCFSPSKSKPWLPQKAVAVANIVLIDIYHVGLQYFRIYRVFMAWLHRLLRLLFCKQIVQVHAPERTVPRSRLRCCYSWWCCSLLLVGILSKVRVCDQLCSLPPFWASFWSWSRRLAGIVITFDGKQKKTCYVMCST